MNRRKWLVVLLPLALLGLGMLVSAQLTVAQSSRTFPETGKTISGRFLDYWLDNGGLTQQGYPISDEMQETSPVDGKTYTTQYFERAVFEKHPENQAPYDVLLSLLGSLLYQKNYPTGAPNQQASTDNPRLFPETGKTLGGIFRAYWESHGGLAQQGLPISDEFQERSLIDGKTYIVQYFERAVFELHTENQPPYNVLLSLLGRFSYEANHGATARTATPTPKSSSAPSATPSMTQKPSATMKVTATATATETATATATETASPTGTEEPAPAALGTLFFYNSTSGNSSTRKLYSNYQLDPPGAPGSAGTGWTSVVAFGPNNKNLLFYNSTSGEADVYTVTDGHRNVLAYTFDTDLNTVAGSVGNTVFFYRYTLPKLIVVTFDETGRIVADNTRNDMSPNYTSIMPLGRDQVMFYGMFTGEAAVYQLQPNGELTLLSNLTFSTGFTNIVQSENGDVVFYNGINGLMTVGFINSSGQYGQLSRQAKNIGQYSTFFRLGSFLFLYGQQSGGVGQFLIEDGAGGIIQLWSYADLGVWTHVVGTQ